MFELNGNCLFHIFVHCILWYTKVGNSTNICTAEGIYTASFCRRNIGYHMCIFEGGFGLTQLYPPGGFNQHPIARIQNVGALLIIMLWGDVTWSLITLQWIIKYV